MTCPWAEYSDDDDDYDGVQESKNVSETRFKNFGSNATFKLIYIV